MLRILSFIFLSVIILLAGMFFYLDLHLHFRPIPKDFEKAMDNYVEAAKFAGASVLVFKDDEVVFDKHYGYANIEQRRVPDSDTIYTMASVSKVVTATAVMKLVEEGVIALDDDVNHYLPFSFRNPYFPDTPITFRLLLSHGASIKDDFFAIGDGYTIGISEDPTESLQDYIHRLFATADESELKSRFFEDIKPGSKLYYSNYGFELLGYLVAQVTKMPFDQFTQQAIFEPLGMESTSWYHRGLDKSRMAMPYGYNAFSKTYPAIGYYGYAGYPSGELKTSAHDFMAFLHVFANRGRTLEGKIFFKPGTIKEFLNVQYPDLSSWMTLAWFKSHNLETYDHGGTSPGVFTIVFVSPSENTGILMFTNTGGFFRAWRTELGVEEIREDISAYLSLHGFPFNQ